MTQAGGRQGRPASALLRVLSRWLPLAVAAAFVPHVLAYQLVYRDSAVRREVYLSTGHAYFRYLPAVLVVVVGLSIFAWLSVALRRSERVGGRLPRVPFALLPPLLFFGQETTESVFRNGAFSFDTYTEKTFLVGIALQIPFGIGAYLLARSLAVLAEELQEIVASVVRPTFVRLVEGSIPTPRAVAVARVMPLASRCAGRAPPRLSSR